VPGVPARIRQVAVDAVANAAETGVLDRALLEDALRRVMDPDRTGQPRGVIMQIRPADYVTMVEGRFAAMSRLGTLDDETFKWARHLYAATRAGYALAQPALAKDPELGHIAEVPILDNLANNACLDLLTIIGFVLLSTRPDAPQGSAFFDPRRSPLRAPETQSGRRSNSTGVTQKEAKAKHASQKR
jgi:hypothetical protein